MPYTANKPWPAVSSDQLRATIPGWGADLDPKDRPSVPRERCDPGTTGARWEFPERQPGHEARERSIEHKFVTPVFGTSMPLKGLSGSIRRYAYRYSEARAAHWLILLAGDRVDAWGAHARSFLTLHPDNPITETGVRSEIPHHGFSSRVGKKRADVNHQWMDPIVVARGCHGAASGCARGCGESSAGWWTVCGTVTDILCLLVLAWALRVEGRRLRDLVVLGPGGLKAQLTAISSPTARTCSPAC